MFKTTGDWDSDDILENEIYMVFFTNILRRVDRMGQKFLNLRSNWVDLAVSEHMKMREDMDRLFELRELVQRTNEKVLGVAKPVPKLGSPLKVLK